MKKVLPLILFFITSMFLQSQETDGYNPFIRQTYNPMRTGAGINTPFPTSSAVSDKKMDVGVQLGTSFSSDFNRGFAFSTFVAPELRYKVSDRFRIRGGVQITNSEYSNAAFYSPYGFASYSGNVTQGLLYVSGDYVVSPKVVISGTAYKEFSISNTNPENAFRPGYDGKGIMMNLRFSPSENVFIDVGAEYYQGNNPWRGGSYNPFGNPMRPYW